MEKFVNPPVFDESKMKPLADNLILAIEKIDGCEIVSPNKKAGTPAPPICLANTVSFVVRGADSIALLAGLDVEGICASIWLGLFGGFFGTISRDCRHRQAGFGKFSRPLFPGSRLHRRGS